MDFIEFEAKDTDQQNEELNDENNNNSGETDGNYIEEVDRNFIDDTEQESDPNFYRRLISQTKDPYVAVYGERDDEDFVDKTYTQPELYAAENRDDVIFDEFSGYEKLVAKFKESLSSFEDSKTENSFFDAIIHELLHKLTNGR